MSRTPEVEAVLHGPELQPLYALAGELQVLGLDARVDASVLTVDAVVPVEMAIRDGSHTSAFQRAVLRPDPHTRRPWWWLLWPEETYKFGTVAPELTRNLPAERTRDMARRIRNTLLLASPLT
ncbi:hypothetical protein [Actinorugispora endophytica]|uniref:Uncharacterized protein n=1 Tax=Actinorugispora endophytica TaxID=1605990 RepID=A0A4R6V7S3_9ACTN|nr:hypothetical protein [Actinorugispora endophytica]TDQ54778.1 hypothetical protein EV190_10194 [Actinorugispora endophytica]